MVEIGTSRTRRSALGTLLASGVALMELPRGLRAQTPPSPPFPLPPLAVPSEPANAAPTVRPPTGKKFPPSAYMFIFKVIDNNVLNNIMLNLTEALEGGVTDLTVAFNCGGGNVDAAVALYDVLHAATVNLTVYNMSAVGSAANVVFQAGKRRLAHPNSHFLFHSVSNMSVISGLNVNSAQEMNESLIASQHEVQQILNARTKIPPADLDDMFRKQIIVDAQGALKYGLIDEITELRFPFGRANIPT